MKAFQNRLLVAALFVCALLCFAFFTPARAEEEMFSMNVWDLPEVSVTGNSTDSASYYISSDKYEKAVARIVKAAKNFEGEVDLSDLKISCGWDGAESAYIYCGAREDHPEIFWLAETWWTSRQDGYITGISFEYINQDGEDFNTYGKSYSQCAPTASERKAAKTMQTKYEKKVKSILAGIPSEFNTTLEKVLYLHDLLAQMNVYDPDDTAYYDHYGNGQYSQISHSGYGAMCTGTCVCSGYARAYKDLLDRLDIPCRYVTSDNLCHAWNAVKVGGNWYEVDITWDDGGYLQDTCADIDLSGYISHDYFLVSRSEMNTLHGCNSYGDTDSDIDSYSYSSVPSCTADEYDSYLFRDAASRMIQDDDGNWYYFDTYGNYRKSSTISASYGSIVASLPNYSGASVYCGDGMCWYLKNDLVYFAAYDTVYVVDSAWKYTPTYLYYTNGYPVKEIEVKGNDLYVCTARGRAEYEMADGWNADGGWYYFEDGWLVRGWKKVSGSWYYMDPNDDGRCAVGVLEIDGKKYAFDKDSKLVISGWCRYGDAWYYTNSSGVVRTGWIKVSGSWYYMDPTTGVMTTGWATVDGTKYCFDSEGKMCTGWHKDTDGAYYYFTSEGKLKTGWLKYNKQWYYLDASTGAMATGWTTVDGNRYHFGTDGVMSTGWMKTNTGTYYYLDPETGVKTTGWKKISGKWYYFGTNGRMRTGKVTISGEVYYFTDSGAMRTGWYSTEDGWLYLDPTDGTRAKSWKTIDGARYHFDTKTRIMDTGWFENSKGAYYYLGKDGKMRTGWTKVSGYQYYMTSDGVMKVGMATIGGKKYCFASNGRMCTGWHKHTDGKYYYFDTKGVMKTGWLTLSGAKYYLNSKTGAMKTGMATIDGKKYCFASSGKMCTGWHKHTDGKYYYFDTKGVMKTGWLTQSGVKYYLDSKTGAMATGWTTIGSKKYSFTSEGKMRKGWYKTSSGRYYLGTDGAMRTGWAKISDEWYYFDDETGLMKKNWATIDGSKYYFGSDGKMRTGWQEIGGKDYLFTSQGAMRTGWYQNSKGYYYYLGTDGAMRTGFVKVDKKWYYMNASGIMKTGWVKVDGEYYYFDKSGAEVFGWLKIGNNWYYFKADGTMACNETVKIGDKKYKFNTSGVWKAS